MQKISSIKKKKRTSHSNSSLSSLLSFIKDSITKNRMRSRKSKRKSATNIGTSEKVIWQQCDQTYLIKNLLRNLSNYGLVGLPNGDQFTGNLVNGLRHGSGIYLYESGAVYDGEWVNNMKHGTGTYYYKDGSKYIGDWREDKRHGKGTYHYINGDIYDGSWLDHGRHGIGKYIYKDTQITFYGTWKDNVRMASQNNGTTSNDECANQQGSKEVSNPKKNTNRVENIKSETVVKPVDVCYHSPITSEIVILIDRLREIISHEDRDNNDSIESLSMCDLRKLNDKPKNTKSFDYKPNKMKLQSNNISLTNCVSQPNIVNGASNPIKQSPERTSVSNFNSISPLPPSEGILSQHVSHDNNCKVSHVDSVSASKVNPPITHAERSGSHSKTDRLRRSNAVGTTQKRAVVSECESKANRIRTSRANDSSAYDNPSKLDGVARANAARLSVHKFGANIAKILNSQVTGAKLSKGDCVDIFNNVSQAIFTKSSDFKCQAREGKSQLDKCVSIRKDAKHKRYNIINDLQDNVSHHHTSFNNNCHNSCVNEKIDQNISNGIITKEFTKYLTDNEENRLDNTNNAFGHSDSRKIKIFRINNVFSE